MNIFTRFWAVWTNFGFIKNILNKETGAGSTWRYWFFWNTIFSVIISIGFYFIATPFIDRGLREFSTVVPEIEITVENGKISSSLEGPIIIKDNNEILENNFNFIFDPKQEEFTEKEVQESGQGVYIFEDKIIIYQPERGKQETLYIKDIFPSELGPVTINKEIVLNFWEEQKAIIYAYIAGFLFIFLWLWLAIFRLLTALWWALIFWIYAKIWGFNNQKFDFGTSYLAVLNFYCIPFIFETIFLFSGLFIPFSTLLIFLAIFSLNFYQLKQSEEKSKKISEKNTEL